jgi:hypothetical protein
MSVNVQMPSAKTLQQSARLSIEHDKPICYYFYNDSLTDNVCIAPYQGDKIIYKNREEHTSPIVKTFKCDTEYLVITENSIYIISSSTKIKR